MLAQIRRNPCPLGYDVVGATCSWPAVGSGTSSMFAGGTEEHMVMELGNFSLSLAVKDLIASQVFYEKLGFAVIGGDAAQGWLILQSPGCVIGLFQGMFEKNTLTFNPGWDASGQRLESFTDVRDIQRQLKQDGVEFVSEADETTSGPASCLLLDPDGNPILLDQHV